MSTWFCELSSRVLIIIGGTGYLGKKLVRACLSQGHKTYVLHRPEIGVDTEKFEMLLSFQSNGARLVPGSFNDYKSLVDAVKLVDVVICAISGVPISSELILHQLELVKAIKEAGNIKRFLPSEFGNDPGRMADAMELGQETDDERMVVRRAIEEAEIRHTYVSVNWFASYFLGGLCQTDKLFPSVDPVILLGDGNRKAIYVTEDDVAKYVIKTIDDPRTLNKTVYIQPPKNILSQVEVVGIWEKLIGRKLQKISISKEEFLSSIKDMDYAKQVGLTNYYDLCHEGSLPNLQIARVPDGEEATVLYPEVNYTTMEEYLKRYL